MKKVIDLLFIIGLLIVGDPVEAKSLGKVLGVGSGRKEPVYMGSLKGNVGMSFFFFSFHTYHFKLDLIQSDYYLFIISIIVDIVTF